ncbi:TonB-dependent receptor domain-containing protein [Simiduia agarivorans]|uniref:TonB-dependent receptor n=1 Tax=Simiduia agarivorans (strain DSM 21679 / JCM 13881 / BCRC 17597 / SA1) TaxID=1117647 RepID=K4L332_SIMAS|nr:TonB-dependent receptor [Simiduia agarivorans]AFV00613.1 hypothetical protein M5M_17420 [Simiduia agarivorans SA1 = DSM 21679]
MVKRTKLATAIKLAAIGAAGAAALAAMPVAAQDGLDALEEVVVTGTRIKDANLVASSPVASVAQEEFQLSGTTRVEDLLNTLPQLSPAFDSFTVNPTVGYATADLRGLGSQRTLVLVNGHRLQPGGIRSEARDLNQIPAALVKRVEVLTGGASAVYGSDAMAGVVNFILDTDFEGVSLNLGTSAYQHNNDNDYIQGLMDARGFDYPTGSSGFDGKSNNIELALGSSFADGKGHAMGYVTWRKNEELRQGARDYSSCALNAAGTACGGSGTAINPNFITDYSVMDAGGNPIINYIEDENNPGTYIPDGQVIVSNFAHKNGSNAWTDGFSPAYNYAPINHYQRPDERYTMGGSMSFEINDNFKPYVETMFANTNTSVQIAESGTFFANTLTLDCTDPLLSDYCSTFATHGDVKYTDATGTTQTVTGYIDPSQTLDFFVGKRNVEGGPRVSDIESSSFRIVTGMEGDINDTWSYDVSYLYGRTASSESNRNDFITDRVGQALLGCPAGSFAGCQNYDVWNYNVNGIDPDAAAAMGGVGIRTGATSLKVFSAYITGDIGVTVPSAQDAISLVAGFEHRDEDYTVISDTNMAEGNFTGLGGPRAPISGGYSVKELFFESIIPVLETDGPLQNLSFDLGYRYSDYSTSGGVSSYKLGFSAQVTDMFRFRGGFNHAIRGPSISELFSDQSIGLWGGDDPCAGEDPELTAAQCANTGVSAGQYGTISESPAAQYNQFAGGNPDLDPEEADTYTLGVVATPIDDLQISLDYYNIEIADRIGTIGASTILNFCATTGDPFLCGKVNRSASGDLWVGSDPASSGYVENLTANFGNLTRQGFDVQAQYQHDLLGGFMNYSIIGGYNLKSEVEPLPGINPDATYDCVGTINISCQMPTWRHTARASYNRDWYSVSLRWRYNGEMDYENTDGTAGTTDQILVGKGGKVAGVHYFDLTATADINEHLGLTVGVNNILDKEPPMVGSTLSLNANAPGGYDQLGRYVFASAKIKF